MARSSKKLELFIETLRDFSSNKFMEYFVNVFLWNYNFWDFCFVANNVVVVRCCIRYSTNAILWQKSDLGLHRVELVSLSLPNMQRMLLMLFLFLLLLLLLLLFWLFCLAKVSLNWQCSAFDKWSMAVTSSRQTSHLFRRVNCY